MEEIQENLQKDLHNNIWKEGWITGLVDGEGSFCIEVQRYGKMKYGICLRPNFAIGLHYKDKKTIEALLNYFGIGNIVKRSIDGHFSYQVSSVKDCLKIAEFFDKNKLLTTKNKDYLLWKDCLNRINNGEHRDLSGLIKILEIREHINPLTKNKRRIPLSKLKEMIKLYRKMTKTRRKMRNWGKNNKIICKIEITNKEDKSIDVKKLKIKDEFTNIKTAQEFSNFYKIFYPEFNFKIKTLK